MRLEIGDQVFHIHFQYGRYDGRRTTRCEVHSDECADSKYSTEICGAPRRGVGFSYCAYQDQFVKRVGRKLSLARAMENLGLTREIRQSIWILYLNRTQKGAIRL